MFGKTLKVAAAVAVAAGALAGCGGDPWKVGAAAIVGDDRITVSALDSAVRDWQKEFKADPVANNLRSNPNLNPRLQLVLEKLAENPRRQALDMMVRIRIGDRMAERSGLNVTEGGVDRYIAENGGQRTQEVTALVYGLPKSRHRDMARFSVTLATAAQKFGANGTPQGEQAAGEQIKALYGQTIDGLKIKVNPRFGSFDKSQESLGPITYKLSARESGVR
ncbi:hypothetical protein [Spirillospora sp. CA-294931]|uniref:hypothetical protein n=1 Tax=Spirillospora sp. CA-294931 TaxID=3240042 RepID=UPI003D92132E